MRFILSHLPWSLMGMAMNGTPGGLLYAFGSATFPATVPTLLAASVPKHHRGRATWLGIVVERGHQVLQIQQRS